jgi:hypothetical protein
MNITLSVILRTEKAFKSEVNGSPHKNTLFFIQEPCFMFPLTTKLRYCDKMLTPLRYEIKFHNFAHRIYTGIFVYQQKVCLKTSRASIHEIKIDNQ